MRDRYYAIVCEKVAALLAAASQHEPLRFAVAQATYKNRHREIIQQHFPNASLWHVSAPPAVCVRRVANTRSGHTHNDESDGTGAASAAAAAHLPAGSAAANTSWVLQHASGFEAPTHPCKVLVNDNDDDPDVLTGRIHKLLGGAPVISHARKN